MTLSEGRYSELSLLLLTSGRDCGRSTTALLLGRRAIYEIWPHGYSSFGTQVGASPGYAWACTSSYTLNLERAWRRARSVRLGQLA